MARVGSSATPGPPSSISASVDGSIATSRCVQLAATSTKRSSPLARPSVKQIDAAWRSGSSAPNEKVTRAVPACSRSISSTAAASRAPDSTRLTSEADHIGAGQVARPSSVITTRISESPPSLLSQPSEAMPCRTNLVQILKTCSGEAERAAALSALQCSARNPRRDSRSSVRASSFGSSTKSMAATMPGRIWACAFP